MRAFLDTNVLISAALVDGASRKLALRLAQRGGLVTSTFVLDEFRQAIALPHLRKRVSADAEDDFIAFLVEHAEVIEARPVRWPENPGDAAIVGGARASASTLISGDKVVLATAARFGVRAMTVRDALDALDAS